MYLFEKVGYIVSGEVLCPSCHAVDDLHDDEAYEHAKPLFADDETDYPLFCAACGDLINLSLVKPERAIDRMIEFGEDVEVIEAVAFESGITLYQVESDGYEFITRNPVETLVDIGLFDTEEDACDAIENGIGDLFYGIAVEGSDGEALVRQLV